MTNFSKLDLMEATIDRLIAEERQQSAESRVQPAEEHGSRRCGDCVNRSRSSGRQRSVRSSSPTARWRDGPSHEPGLGSGRACIR